MPLDGRALLGLQARGNLLVLLSDELLYILSGRRLTFLQLLTDEVEGFALEFSFQLFDDGDEFVGGTQTPQGATDVGQAQQAPSRPPESKSDLQNPTSVHEEIRENGYQESHSKLSSTSAVLFSLGLGRSLQASTASSAAS